jgi:hypothetical protein
LLAISFSREKGTGGVAEAAAVCVCSEISMLCGLSFLTSCNAATTAGDAGGGEHTGGWEVAAMDGVKLGIRRVCRDDKDARVKLCRNFVSRDRRRVPTVGIGELSILVSITMPECLFGELLADDLAFRSLKLAMTAVAMIR